MWGLCNKAVKIGEITEYSPPLLKVLKLRFSREKVSKFLEKILGPQFKINPDMDFIKNGVEEYRLIKDYFGYDKTEKNQTERDNLLSDLRDPNSDFYQEMLEVFGDEELVGQAANILDRHREENFLPKEQTVVGHPPNITRDQIKEYKQQGKELPFTYYIFQEPVQGDEVKPLLELTDKELKENPELLEKLITFAVLIKKMYSDTGKIIDTRPQEPLKHPFEWFGKTDNLLVDKKNKNLSFIDTRWLWDKNSKLGEEGVNFVKWLGVASVDRAIRKYTKLLNKN